MDYDIVRLKERITDPNFSLSEALPKQCQISVSKPAPEKVVELLVACVPHLPNGVSRGFLVSAFTKIGYKPGSAEKNYLSYLKDTGIFENTGGKWCLTTEFIENVINNNVSSSARKSNGLHGGPADVSVVTVLETLDKKTRTVWEYLLSKSEPYGGYDDRMIPRLNTGSYDRTEQSFVELKNKHIENVRELKNIIKVLQDMGVLSFVPLDGDGGMQIKLFPGRMSWPAPEGSIRSINVEPAKDDNIEAGDTSPDDLSAKEEGDAPIETKTTEDESEESLQKTLESFKELVRNSNFFFEIKDKGNYQVSKDKIIALLRACVELQSFPLVEKGFVLTILTEGNKLKNPASPTNLSYLKKIGVLHQDGYGKEAIWKISPEFISDVLSYNKVTRIVQPEKILDNNANFVIGAIGILSKEVKCCERQIRIREKKMKALRKELENLESETEAMRKKRDKCFEAIECLKDISES